LLTGIFIIHFSKKNKIMKYLERMLATSRSALDTCRVMTGDNSLFFWWKERQQSAKNSCRRHVSEENNVLVPLHVFGMAYFPQPSRRSENFP
jgi:hypothetical protein